MFNSRFAPSPAMRTCAACRTQYIHISGLYNGQHYCSARCARVLAGDMKICATCGTSFQFTSRSFMLHDTGEYVLQYYCSETCGLALENAAARNRSGTKYAQKRRLLRRHRQEMRLMVDIIETHDLEDEYQDYVEFMTGNSGLWLAFDRDMDEGSDVDDPEAQLNAEASDRTALIGALTEHRRQTHMEQVLLDLERARMTI